jgi:hypothetical protein
MQDIGSGTDQGALDMSDFTGTNAANPIGGNARAVRHLPVGGVFVSAAGAAWFSAIADSGERPHNKRPPNRTLPVRPASPRRLSRSPYCRKTAMIGADVVGALFVGNR